jgi:hypothetical protein
MFFDQAEGRYRIMESKLTRDLDSALTVGELADILERFALSSTVGTDVNITAGVALNTLLGIDD